MAINFRAFSFKPFWVSLIFLLFSTISTAQVTIWLEDFSGAPPPPGWNPNFTDCDGNGSVGVMNNRFEINDQEGAPCCPAGGGNDNDWTTNAISIDGYCSVSLSVDYGSIGTFECVAGGPFMGCSGNVSIDNGHDQMIFEYSIDGGAWTRFTTPSVGPVMGYLCGGGTGTATVSGLSGSNIQIRILVANKAVAETYWIDNVTVQGFLPPELNPINPIEVCAGATVNVPLTSTPAGATFTWTNDNTAIGLMASGSGTPINFTAASVTSQEVATISVNTSQAGCSGPGGTFMITVNPAPTADDPGDITVCAGEPVNISLTSPAGANLNWTNNNTNTGLMSSGNGDISFNAANVATVQTSTVTITPSLNGCTGPNTSFLITVSPLPNVNQPNNVTACAGTMVNVNFGGAAGATLNWTNDNPAIGLAGSGIGNINFNSLNVSSQEVATITVTPTNAANCDGTPRTFTITINPASVVDNPGNIVACSGSQLDISFTGTATNYNWVNNNTGTGIPSSGSNDISVITPVFFGGNQVSNITVNPTGTCPGGPVVFTVTVQPTTQINPVNDVVACSGQTVNVALSGQPANAALSWSNSNTAIGLGAAGSGSISFPAANVNMTQTALITISSAVAACPGPDETFQITINPGPTMNAVSNVAVCGNSPINIAFSGAGAGATYSWTNNNTATGIPATGTGSIMQNVATPAVTQVSNISVVPSAGGCAGPAVNFTVTVNGVPVVNDPPDTAVCAGAPLAINFTGTTGASFSWTNSNTNTGLAPLGMGNISFTTSSTVTAPEVSTVNVTPSIGTCTGTPVSFNITVNPAPTLTVTAVNCAGNLLTYSVTITSNAATITATAGVIIASGGNFTIDFIPAGTNVTITASAGANCSVQQTVNAPNCNCPAVPAPGNPGNQTICEGNPIPALTVTTAAGLEVDWYDMASGGVILQANALSYTPPGPFAVGTYTFYAEARDPGTGCVSAVRTAVTLTVNITPTMTTPVDTSFCAGTMGSVIFTGTTGANFNWISSNTNFGIPVSGVGDITFSTMNTQVTDTAIISVSPSIGSCFGPPNNFIIIVNALPTLTVGTIQCAPNLLSYSVTINSNADTLVSPLGVVSTIAGGFLIDQIPADSNIIITVTDTTGGCTASLNITAPNCNCPSVPLATGANNPSVCEGAPIPALTVTAGTGLVVDWYADPTGGTALQTNALSYSPAGPFAAGMYTFYAETRDTATGCVSNGRAPVQLTVNATPTMTTPADVQVCPGDLVDVTFTGTAGATFDWTNSNTAIGQAAAGTGDINFTAATGITMPESGNISVTPTLGTCPGTPANFVITVNVAPTLTPGTAQCSPDLSTYSVVITTNAVTLTTSAGVVTPGTGSYTIDNVPAGTNIVVTGQSAAGCPATLNITAPSCACPPVPEPTNPNNPTICQGAAIPALTVSAAAVQEVNWYAAATGGTPIATNTLSFTPLGPLSAGTYTFYAETRDPATGCTSLTRTAVVLTVSAAPTMTPPANVTVCSGDMVNVMFSGSPGAVFHWTSSNPAIGLAATSGTGDISFTSAPGLLFTTSSTMSVYPESGGCQGVIQNFSIVVNPLPILAQGVIQCAPDLQSYSVTVSTNGTTVTATAGTVTGSGFSYTISQIPEGEDVIIFSSNTANCTAQLVVTAPDCPCPTVTPPGNPNNPTACAGDPIADLSVSVNPGLQVNWYDAATGGTLLASNTTTFTPPGQLPVGVNTFYAEAVDPFNGCTSSRIPVTATITNGITATVFGNATVCAGQSTTLTASGGNTFAWSTGATTASVTVMPLTSTTYTVTVTNNGLCGSTVSTPVTVNLPVNVTINAVTCDPAQAGTNTQTFIQPNGCDSVVTTITTIDLANCMPEVVVVTDSVNCNGSADGGISLIPNDGFPPYDYTWMGGGLSGSGQIATTGAFEIIEDLPAGNYSITVTGANGASVVVTGLVLEPPPIDIELTANSLSCFGNNDGQIASIVSGGNTPFQYIWSDGQTTADLTGITMAGTYTVTVTDSKDCTVTASATITSPEPFDIELTELPVQCGDQTISYTPEAIGGIAPFTYLVDGDSTTDIRLKLTAGEHTITIRDDKGCTADTTVFVVIPVQPLIELPQDTVVFLGEILDLSAQTNLSVWDTIIWNPLPDTLRQGTLQQQWSPLASGVITVMITDTLGCKSMASMLVTVSKENEIYAPNVFSPDLDGQNDFWQIFSGPSVEALEEVHIYDRWGESIYVWNDVVPLSQWPGWDGTTRNKKANPGVYVYYAWLKLVDGNRLLIKGDITLVR